MLACTISLVQVLAILACPLTCLSGHACCGIEHFQAASQRTLETVSEASQPQESACSCGCDNALQEEGECPPAAPESQTVCQGVCGGAILEKSCEFPIETTVTALPPVNVGGSVFTASEVQPLDDSLCLYGSGNYGRSLRTLHNSFLC